MEAPRGILSRLAEKVLGWLALGLLIGLGVALWQMGPERRAALWSAIWRSGVWLVLAAALPWATRLFLRRILALGSNWAGVALLAGLALVDLVAGLVLMGGWPSSGWGWVASVTALGLAASYNYLVVEYLAEQLGG